VGTFGVSSAVNTIVNEVRSYISGSTLNVVGVVDLAARSDARIWSLTVAGSGGGAGGAVGGLVGSGR